MIRILATSLILFSVISSVFATHGAHVEISYYWKQDSTYEITVWMFKRHNSIAKPHTIPVAAESKKLSLNSTIVLYLDTNSAKVNALLRPDMPFDCGDSDTLITSRKQYVYRGQWTSQGRSDDWILSYELCCRIGGRSDYPPDGLENVEPAIFHIEIGINNLDILSQVAKNISPVWHNPVPHLPGHLTDTVLNYPVNTLCQNKNYLLDHSVKEYDGDSIVYSLYHPQNNGGDTVSYRLSYNFNDPMPTSGLPVNIDLHTGILSLKPTAPKESGCFVLGIQADEFRNGIHLGFIRRELSFNIIDSVVTGMAEYNKESMDIYPNPSSGILNVAIEHTENAMVTLFNTAGNLVFSQNVNSDIGFEILLPDSMKNGMYFVVVASNSKNYSKKIFVYR